MVETQPGVQAVLGFDRVAESVPRAVPNIARLHEPAAEPGPLKHQKVSLISSSERPESRQVHLRAQAGQLVWRPKLVTY